MKKHYTSILSSLDKCRTMTALKQLHGLVITTSVIRNVIPLSRLIDFCTNSEGGDFNYAKLVFNQIEVPSVYIWNSMIRGYSNNNDPYEALLMYREMQRRGYSPDHFTFPFVLKACSVLTNPNCGTSVHNRIVKTGFELDAYACCALLNMYASCTDMESGVKVFDLIPKWNVAAWTSLIAGYLNNGWPSKAIEVFKDMESWNVEPNEKTLVNVLVACAHRRDIETGKCIHGRVCQLGYDPFESGLTTNVILATAIMDMYAKCGSLRYARNLFYRMPQRNLIAWNSIIGAFIQYGRLEEALGLFLDMLIAGFLPDRATFLSIITCCAQLGALALGQSIHALVLKTCVCEDTAIGTALVGMYAKIGDARSARQIFSKMEKKDVIAWTSMIVGLAMHGHAEEALSTFKRMEEEGSVIPDEITYMGVLWACCHGGLVEEGQRHFTAMADVYNLQPTVEHYGCMVDLLSRAGHFEEAERLVMTMPVAPNIAIWGALLNGCDIHENVNLVDQLRSRISEMNPQGSGVYVLLSNIYARAGKWQQAKLARESMAHRRIAKTPGHSSVELKLQS